MYTTVDQVVGRPSPDEPDAHPARGATVEQDLIIFDTSTLPEYYNDVHNILALPPGYVTSYDYSARNVSDSAVELLRRLAQPENTQRARAVLAYMQDNSYMKGQGSNDTAPLPKDSFQTLTRLCNVVAVRAVSNNDAVRYYIDLELLGYPFDRDNGIVKKLVETLGSDIPMKKYVSIYPDTSADALFSQKADDQAFSQVVDSLSARPSQFSQDTFWRLKKITTRSKSIFPMMSTKTKDLRPQTRSDGDRRYSVLDVVDQTTLHFHLQFHRGKEEPGTEYRIRKISVEGSPKASSDQVQSSFTARSFGQETVAVAIPATSSLTTQEARFQFLTKLHDQDDRKDYGYGPQLNIAVSYRKDLWRSLLAIASLCTASGLFGWAALSTSVLAGDPKHGTIAPIACRVAAIVIGVLASVYAYYLWTDEVALDKARRT
jgi:hypothetical protein